MKPRDGRSGDEALGDVTEIAPFRRSTPRMLLRPLEEADWLEFARVAELSRLEWAPWTPAPESDQTGHAAFLGELLRTVQGAKSGTHVRLAGFTERGALVGTFALNEIVRGALQSAYASWQVSSDLVGQGLGTEGVRAILDLAFDDAPGGLGLHRVQANIMPANAASIHIAEKVGFRREGVARRYLKIAGRWEDHLMFAVTKDDRDGAG